MKENNQGFTLIELIAVITILGILAAIAVPKFISVQTEAREAVLEGVQGTMLGAANLVFAKALIQELDRLATSSVDTSGDGTGDTAAAYGYPTTASIVSRMTIQSNELINDAASGVVGYSLDGVAGIDATCRVTYGSATLLGGLPTVTISSAGC